MSVMMVLMLDLVFIFMVIWFMSLLIIMKDFKFVVRVIYLMLLL